MSPEPGAAFPRPCIVSLHGCQRIAILSRVCENESRTVNMCGSCFDTWKANAESASLYDRCPMCSVWRAGTRLTGSPAARAALSGDVADLFVAAMEAEGISSQVRHDVLAHLNRDAFWLTDIARPNLGIPVPVIDWETVVIV